jgi:hypothetical protein
MEIVDVDEGPRGKGREAEEARRDAGGLASLEGEEDQRGRMLAQAFDQHALGGSGQVGAVAHSIESPIRSSEGRSG